MKTREKIVKTAQDLIEKKGKMAISISEVAAEIGITHAAIYKYFKNKNELLQHLAEIWLDETSQTMFPFDKGDLTNLSDLAHAWLWELARSKKAYYDENPVKFKLYTDFIGQNENLTQKHTSDLMASYAETTGNTDFVEDFAAYQAFIPFIDPHYANTWDEQFQVRFEAVWSLVKPYFDEKDLTKK